MPHIASITSFVFALAGLICVLGWSVRGYRAYRGDKVVVGHLLHEEGVPPITFTFPFKPLPAKVLWVGIALLFLALITFGFSPLAPPWRS